MKIKTVKRIIAKKPVVVTDMLIDEGFRPGGRVSLPDIDIDYASDGRLKVKSYIEERYNSDGTQNVFSAGNLTTLKMKAALKDVCKVHRVPYALANYTTAMIKDDGMTWTGLFKECMVNKKMKKFVNDYPKAIEDIRSIMNQPRSTSIHASAVIVTPKFKDGKRVECFDYLPLRIMDGLLVSEFDGYSVEEIGLLKNDVLATKELMKIRNTINLVNENYPYKIKEMMSHVEGEDILTMEAIHTKMTNDKGAFSLFSNGYTQNIFQFSGRGMTKFVSDMGLDSIDDITAANALYRPATIDIKAHEDYIRYKRGEATPTYNWGTYDSTSETHGIMAYQEQMMRISQTVGGFSLSKADVLRKAIGKKNTEIMASLKRDFIDGAVANQCPVAEAKDIWRKIELAGRYSFNKSHAAAYGLIAYDGAWLKSNFPTAFYTVALQFCKDEDIKVLMGEMSEISNCQIVPPDVNVSGLEFFTNYDTDEIFWSLSRIKFVGAKAVNSIIEDRVEFGAFTSIEDFYIRMQARSVSDKAASIKNGDRYTNPVNSRTIKNMILTGCFDNIENTKEVSDRFFILEKFYTLIGGEIDTEDFPGEMIDKHYFWSMLQVELSGLGSVDYRRIFNNSKSRLEMKKTPYLSLKDALDMENEGRRCAVCATVVDISEKSGKTKKGDPYLFGKVQLQQNNETIECTIWNDTWIQKKPLLADAKGKVVVINGNLKYNSFSNGNAMTCGSSVVIEII